MLWSGWALLFCADTAEALSIWEVGRRQGHVEAREDVPSPEEFWDAYVRPSIGPFQRVGKPVLLRGAARGMPAYRRWTDRYLRYVHGQARLDVIETEKKETRSAQAEEDWTLSRFLAEYNSSALYSAASTPEALRPEVYLLPSLSCGGYTKRLVSTSFWLSSGSTKSAIHMDSLDNVHCMIAGRKDWILWRPDSGINSGDMGWVVASGEAQSSDSWGYGQFSGRVDVDDVDLARFPGWAALDWWHLSLGPGDCAFLPGGWFHFVQARPLRSLGVHLWFLPGEAFESLGCQMLRQAGLGASDVVASLADCTWGYGTSGRRHTGCSWRVRQHAVTEDV